MRPAHPLEIILFTLCIIVGQSMKFECKLYFKITFNLKYFNKFILHCFYKNSDFFFNTKIGPKKKLYIKDM